MPNNLPQLLARIQLFKNCTPFEIEQISSLMRPKEVKKRDILFYEGEPCEVIYFIDRGRVKIYKTTEDGREQIVNLIDKGDMLPHVGWYGGSTYPATAEALEDGQMYFMLVSQFTQFLEQSPSTTLKFLQELDGKIRELHMRLATVLSKDMSEKILNVLGFLAKNMGKKVGEAYELEIDLTHQDIANMVGTTRETASRMIGQLKKEGKISLDHKSLMVKG